MGSFKKSCYRFSKWFFIILFFAVLSCKVTLVYADPLGDVEGWVQIGLEEEGDVEAGAEEGTEMKEVAEETSEVKEGASEVTALGAIETNTGATTAALGAKNTWDQVTKVAKLAVDLGAAMGAAMEIAGMIWETVTLGTWNVGKTQEVTAKTHAKATGSPDTLQTQLVTYNEGASVQVPEKDQSHPLNINPATKKPVKEYSNTSAGSLHGLYQYSKHHKEAANNFIINSSGAGVGIAKPKTVTYPTREHISHYALFNLTAANQSHATNTLAALFVGGVTPNHPLHDPDNKTLNKSALSQAVEVLTFQICIPKDKKDSKNNFFIQAACFVFNMGAAVPAGLYVFVSFLRLSSGMSSGLLSMVTAGFQRGVLNPSRAKDKFSQAGVDSNKPKKVMSL